MRATSPDRSAPTVEVRTTPPRPEGDNKEGQRTRTSLPISPAPTERENNKEANKEVDWEKRIREHKEQLELETEKREQQTRNEELRENSWELYRLCRDYLEKNQEDWEKH